VTEVSIFDQRMWTVQELAAFLRVQPNTVYTHLKDWPHTRVTPSDIRFTEDNVRAILALMTKQPSNEPKRVPRVGTRASRRKQ
jgi:hypothetical protein